MDGTSSLSESKIQKKSKYYLLFTTIDQINNKFSSPIIAEIFRLFAFALSTFEASAGGDFFFSSLLFSFFESLSGLADFVKDFASLVVFAASMFSATSSFSLVFSSFWIDLLWPLVGFTSVSSSVDDDFLTMIGFDEKKLEMDALPVSTFVVFEFYILDLD